MRITLKQKMDESRSNNLNLIKFIAAITVIFSHSFYVCYGGNHADPLSLYTNVVSFGGVAVAIFLFASGLFVSKSLERCKSGKVYFGARMIRIFPLLITIILITTFILGPIVTEVSLIEYFTSLETYKYLSYIVMIPVYELTGVFTSNPASLVNGPLWTLILEFICYIALYIAYKLGFFKKERSWIVCVGILIGTILISFNIIPFLSSLSNYIRPLILFFVGMVYYIYRDKIQLNGYIAIVFSLLLVVAILIGYPNLGILLFLPYIITYISYTNWQCPENIANLGIYSYGIYLVAYPIQQTLRLYISDITPMMNTILTSIIAIVLAIFLNKFIEEPCIKYYNKKWRK